LSKSAPHIQQLISLSVDMMLRFSSYKHWVALSDNSARYTTYREPATQTMCRRIEGMIRDVDPDARYFSPWRRPAAKLGFCYAVIEAS